MSIGTEQDLNVEKAVRSRYSRAAKQQESDLCCAPISYDAELLKAIPREVIEKDYGCGNPIPYLKKGESVLDLGSGSGKAYFLASQVIGSKGKVIGVDMNDDMLTLAQKSIPYVARNVGYCNVEFRKGKIQDLALDVVKLERYLEKHPIRTVLDLDELNHEIFNLKKTSPLIPSNSIDVVISNCVLNLVRPKDKEELFKEMYRVLRKGGRAVVSDIVSDQDVPQSLKEDPELWSGCISGAFRDDLFLNAFENVGFEDVAIVERKEDPWRTVQGVEFRSITVKAFKEKNESTGTVERKGCC